MYIRTALHLVIMTLSQKPHFLHSNYYTHTNCITPYRQFVNIEKLFFWKKETTKATSVFKMT